MTKPNEGLPGEGFMMTAEMACVFYEICLEHNITERADKIQLLRMLVAEGDVKYIRDPKAFLADKKFVQIKYKEKPPLE